MIQFEEVRTQEQIDDAIEFAEGFQHIIDPRTALPMVMAKKEGKNVGYFHIFNQPIISFAFHTDPDVCKPRDFKEIVDKVKAWRFLNSMSPAFPNGVCFAHCPTNSVIPFETIERMGFKSREKILMQANG